ncbi:short-subunit dehydrogenase [Xanthomonas arboricola]
MHRTFPAHVVISGASSGIGQATAEAFAERGARLVLAARGEDALQAVAERCRARGATVLVVPTDVKHADQVKALATAAQSFLGRVDLWFGNVGVGAVGKFHEVPIDASAAVIHANLLGRMHDAHAAIPIFIAQGHGVFVNMISSGGFAPTPYAAAYSASKFGQRGFSEALRAELADYPRIHVCDVYPYFVDTPGLTHGANYVGRRLGGPPLMLDTRTVAAAVLRLLDRPRATVVLGAPVHAMRAAHALAPNLLARLTHRVFTRYFAQAPRVLQSSGNVLGPPAIAGGIDGGYRRRAAAHPRSPRNTLVIGAAAAGLAALAVLALRRR